MRRKVIAGGIVLALIVLAVIFPPVRLWLVRILIGILLLIAGLLLLLVLLIVAPVSYKVQAYAQDGKYTGRARLGYFFGLLRIVFWYDGAGEDKLRHQLYIGPVKLNIDKIQYYWRRFVDFFNLRNVLDYMGKVVYDVTHREEASPASEPSTPVQDTLEAVDIEPAEQEAEPPPPKGFAKWQARYEKITGKIKMLKTYAETVLPTWQTAIKPALKNIGKVARPKKLKITATIGFADPATTANFFGIYAMAIHLLGIKNIHLHCNFDTDVLYVQGRGVVSGRFSLWQLSYAILKEKGMRQLIMDFFK